jgi:hypothetical protein
MRHLVPIVLAATGCQRTLADTDGAFVGPNDHVRVHCAVNLDAEAQNSWASLDSGLDRAAQRGEIVELYAHEPGVTVGFDTVEHVLAGAYSRGLAFDTYDDLARGTAQFPGLVLSFDDTWVDEWTMLRPQFDQFGAHVTFFISRYYEWTDAQKAELHVLAADGHAIEPHSVLHQRAPLYVEDHGLDAYMADEFQPSLDALTADGYTFTTFAYPFGARTDETDRAILERVTIVRSVAFTFDGEGGPCPR